MNPALQKSCTPAEGWALRGREATPLQGSGSPRSILVKSLLRDVWDQHPRFPDPGD